MRQLLFAAFLTLLCGVSLARAGDFSDWTAVVVAGDWRAHGGGDSDAFDNARRDVAAALVEAGFDPAHVKQFSLRPPRRGDPSGLVVAPVEVVNAFQSTALSATGGCLFYVTSHGSPDGANFGTSLILSPYMLERLLDDTCHGRPTVAIVSACFSGVFVPGLEAPERMILTAAASDRSSFGCSDKDRYPWFDACVLESMPKATDFPAMAEAARACVTRRETEQKAAPPSNPQLWLGGEARVELPLLKFEHRPPGPLQSTAAKAAKRK